MARGKRRLDKEEEPPSFLGRKLAVLRGALDLTQSDLSRKSKVKRASISEYEAGLTNPDASTLERLLAAMRFKWTALDLAGWFLARLFSECRLSEESSPQATDITMLEGMAAEMREMAAHLTRMAEALRGAPTDALAATEQQAGNSAPENLDATPSPEDRVAARTLWARIRTLPRKEQEDELERAPRGICWAICELLCYESQRLCGEHPASAARVIELAQKVAERVSGGEARQAKVRGIVWAHHGNVLRVRGEFQTSESAFSSAEQFLEAGAGAKCNLLEEGLVFALKASLRRAQRRFDEAAELLERAAALARGRKFRTQVLISWAKLFDEQGDLERSVAILQSAEGVEIPDDDGRLLLCVRHNLADNLSKLDRFEEAKTLLPEARILSRKVGGEMDHTRLLWTEGRVAAGLEDTEEGIRALVRVRGEFASQGMGYDTALVSLELAAIYAGQGRTSEVKALARHMVPIFQAKDVHREALAALTLFRRAAEKDQVTAEWAREMLAYLRKARYNPELRFEEYFGAVGK